MSMPPVLFFLVLSIFQEYMILARQRQRPPDVANANTNDAAAFFTTEPLIRYLNTPLEITWLLCHTFHFALE
jgi:hypothetical protein